MNSKFLTVWAGTCASIISSVIWAIFAIILEIEIGYAALGLGAIVGYILILFKNDHGKKFLVTLASILSFFGIVFGKYFFIVKLSFQKCFTEF